MKWFGQSWGAPICDPDEHCPTPVGERCARCLLPIGEREQGLIIPHLFAGVTQRPWHLLCFLHSTTGHKGETA